MVANEATPLVSANNTEQRGPVPVLDDTYNDNPEEMTIGRRLARFLSQFSWYNPHVAKSPANTSDDNVCNEGDTMPSLDRAWAYFEHVTLSRYFVTNGPVLTKDLHRKAEAGEMEEPTRLYDVWKTSEADLADFGIGMGMYFYTLRTLALTMLVAGLICIPNLIYFASDSYNSENDGLTLWSLRASAICTDTTWVSCPTCKKSDWDHFPRTYHRYAETESGLRFLQVNNCHIGPWVGMVAYTALVFVCCSVYAITKYAYKKEKEFDFASQTTSDYALEVANPPTDARDVEEWRAFFSRFGHVTSITVALDNEELLAAMIKRRTLTAALQSLQPASVTVDHQHIEHYVKTALDVPWHQRLFFSDAPSIQKHIHEIDERIKNDLSQRNYGVSNVFCIFETEASQQAALTALSVRGVDILRNNIAAVSEVDRFRGNHLLSVQEPPEPSTIRWNDLDESLILKLRQRLVTFILTIILIVLSCLLVSYVRFQYGPGYAALAITAMNSLAPATCRYMTSLESHSSEDSMQASLYYKITACLWILSAIITAFVTPFVDTLNNEKESLIPAMYAVFITEMLKAPITQALDIPGNVKRHILAPRALDQRRMNAYFMGSPYEISERYTDMTNVLFMTFYYAAIFPAGFFFAALTLAVHYFVDKFCLLRNWARAPMVGSKVADMSRNHFFSSALAIYAIMSSYNFASFPYDNACKLDNVIPSDYVGYFHATDGAGNPVSIAIEEDASVYKYCNQDMLRYHPPAFPAVPSNQPQGDEWMDPEQAFTSVFGWTSVWITLFVMGIFLNVFRKNAKRLLWSRYEPHSTDRQTNEKFSDVKDICAYVPQVRVTGYLFPTILCDITAIDHEELMGWEDYADPSKVSHNAIYDVTGLADKAVFSIVRHWKP